MKAAAFEYLRPENIEQALGKLKGDDLSFGKVLGGGQSLGPMMNLRLVQPDKLVDVSALSELQNSSREGESLRIGAAICHAQIEDRKIPDETKGLLTYVAGGIAHRAVRNRGTLGGSLVHADPSADWVATMRLLDATLILQSPDGTRRVKARQFFIAAFTTAIEDNEVLVAVEVPCFSSRARWSYQKTCRKPGEFADALVGIWIDPALNIHRAVIGALSVPPHLIEGLQAIEALTTRQGANRALDEAGVSDPVDRQLQTTMLHRALKAVDLLEGEALL